MLIKIVKNYIFINLIIMCVRCFFNCLIKLFFYDKICLVINMHYVYILKCADGTLYTGWTTNLENRIKAHNSKKGAKYTRSRTPVELFYSEEFETKSEALKREAAIKKMSRADKTMLQKQKPF